MRIDEEVDLGREVAGGPENDPVDRFPTGRSRAAETLLRSPPFAPAAVEIRADLRDMGWIAVKVGATWHPATANQADVGGKGSRICSSEH